MKNQIKKSLNVITNINLGLTKSILNTRFDAWERVLLGILYDQITIGNGSIDYLLNPKELPDHNYRDMKSDDFINMLNKKLPGFGEIGRTSQTINPDFLESLSKIVGTHLILAINTSSNKINYIGGIKYKILFIDEGMLCQNNLVFKIYQIITDNEEFASRKDEEWLKKRAAYRVLERVILTANLNISEHTRSILRHLYAPVALESPETLCGLCKPDCRKKPVEVDFKEDDLSRINSIRGSSIFNSHDLENFMASELKPEYDYYVFRIFSSIEKTPTKKMVLHISGFTGYLLDREINKIHDLTKEQNYFEVYMRIPSHID